MNYRKGWRIWRGDKDSQVKTERAAKLSRPKLTKSTYKERQCWIKLRLRVEEEFKYFQQGFMLIISLARLLKPLAQT